MRSRSAGLGGRPRRGGVPIAVALLCAAISLLAGCAPVSSSDPDGSPDPRLRGEWQLRAADDDKGSLDIGQSAITLVIADELHSGGDSGCGPYSARVIGRPGAAFVTVTSDTLGSCVALGGRSPAQRYFRALGRVDFAAVGDGTLTLSGADVTLRFVTVPSVELARVTDIGWVAVGPLRMFVHDSQLTSAVPTPTGFTMANGKISGTAGCAIFFGSYGVEGRTVETTFVHTDKRQCSGASPADVTQTNEVIAALTGRFTARRQGGTLTVFNTRAGLSMTFSLQQD